ncbi:hypothetical protein ACFQV4_38375 [Streptomyces thermocarboxydus]
MGFALFLVCAIAVLISAARAAAMALPGRLQPWPDHLLRRTAATLGWVAGAVYALGLAGVAWSEAEVGDGANSTPAPACREGFAPETIEGLTHHRASYLLRFDCVREDGRLRQRSGPGVDELDVGRTRPDRGTALPRHALSDGAAGRRTAVR